MNGNRGARDSKRTGKKRAAVCSDIYKRWRTNGRSLNLVRASALKAVQIAN